jgi:hypothetical protein
MGDRLDSKRNLPMTQGERKVLRVVGLFLLVQFPLVHCLGWVSPGLSQAAKAKSGSTKKQQPAAAPAPDVRYGSEGLPAPVEDMREAILSAVRSGRIEELRHAWELNELKPELGVASVGDAIAHWKQISGDGEGREILAALAEILDAGYVVLPLGRDLENNRLYVWPYFAEVPLDKLSPVQEVELLRLVPPAVAKEMRTAGKYTHWRIVIGADGTWHSFRRGP